MRRLRSLGTTLMITVAIAIQPVQYGLLAGVGRALAQAGDPCGPVTQRLLGPSAKGGATSNGTVTPIYECEPQVNPGGGGTTTSPKVAYFLLPGIGDGPPTNGQSTYFNPTGLPGFLMNTGQTAVPVSAVQPWADWKNKNLTVQGSELSSKISATAAANTNIILIGHSMGGLRGRSALQFNNTSNPSLQTNVKALVTLGTPHFGAPIIDKGKPAATLLGGVLGVSLSAFVGLGPYLSGAVGMFGARAWAASILDTPSGQDMRQSPNNSFLNRLNAPSSAEKIPANVALLRVSGQNSDIDSYGASAGIAESTAAVGALRSNLGNVTLIAGVVAMGMAFFTFGATIPWALALFAASYLLLNLPAFWRNNVMGAAQGDAIVPQDSQNLPAGIGGKQVVADLDLSFAVHTGRYGEYQVNAYGEYVDNQKLRARLQALQVSLNIPVSKDQ